MQTISFLYDDYRKVQSVLADLERSGVPVSATALVARDADERYRSVPATDTLTDDALFGAIVGGLAGLGFGVIAATGAFDMSAFTSLSALGGLLASAVMAMGGAVCGWLTGALLHFVYARDDLAAGGTIVSVNTDDERAAIVEAIMRQRSVSEPPLNGDGLRANRWQINGSMAPGFVSRQTSRQRSDLWS